ncbi:hypothetical protein [Flavobacterium fluviatile]|uniref:hypothetical protein n=1 Tax=Flavobacterium fluviatile TaxID=1862387 RepID=UPI0013D6B0AA|nr:hypothetical protein [Flavobacterium fluviatile]
MTVYVISFFDNKQSRYDSFRKLIETFLKLNVKIVVLWMNHEHQKILHPDISYINSEKTNASVARNKLLKLFYSSDQHEAIFSDDDVQILNVNILNEPFDNYDVITFLSNISHRPHRYYFFASTLFKIQQHKEIYFDESLEANQDLDFGYNCFFNGVKIKEVYTKDVYNDKENSVMFKDENDRKKKKKEAFHKINQKYGTT